MIADTGHQFYRRLHKNSFIYNSIISNRRTNKIKTFYFYFITKKIQSILKNNNYIE